MGTNKKNLSRQPSKKWKYRLHRSKGRKEVKNALENVSNDDSNREKVFCCNSSTLGQEKCVFPKELPVFQISQIENERTFEKDESIVSQQEQSIFKSVACENETSTLLGNVCKHPAFEKDERNVSQQEQPIFQSVPSENETSTLLENVCKHPAFEKDERNVSQQEQPIFQSIPSENETSTSPENASKHTAFEGRRITDPLHFYNELKEMYFEHGFREQCSFHDLYYEKSRDNGLCSKLKFVCNHCGYFKWINLIKNDDKIMPLNDAAVVGTIAAGTGFFQLKQQLAAMAIPCMSDITYRKYRQNLVSSFEKAAQEAMDEAAAMERDLAIMEGDTINGVPFITVQVDGSWLKRSYKSGKFDSLSGCAAIIGCRTNKVLYVGVRNKFCHVCDLAERKNCTPKKHRCFKNWGREQSSSSMEKDIIVEGFLESIEKHNLIYKTVIGDGDSSVYKAILDSNPYRQYGVRVEKIECINHLLRNMCNKIVDASRGRMMHSLARGNVTSFREYVQKCSLKIRQHIMTLIKIKRNKTNWNDEIKSLQRQILNSVHHIFGNHTECSKLQIPCEKTGNKNWIPTLKSTGMYYAIQKAVSDVSCHVRSLIRMVTSNHVESFNAIVAKVVGGKRINFGQRDSYYVRVHAAVVQYNTQSMLTKFNNTCGYDTSSVITSMEQSAKEHIRQKKTLRRIQGRQRKRYVKTGNKDYGESANRPDVSPEAYQVLLQEHLEKLKKDQANRMEIERLTVTQSESDLWHQKRSELLTSSNFGKICRRKNISSCASIVRSILYPPVGKLPAFTYGIEKEARSREMLSKKLKQKIEIAGLLIDANDEYLGASVDGLIGSDGIVELKNPISAANLTISQALKCKPNLRRIFSKCNINKMNPVHVYYYQVQGQLHITNRKYCIFALCTQKDLKYVKVERDDDFWLKKMAVPLRRFYFDCLLPELLDSRHNRNMPLREPEYVLQAQNERKRKAQKPCDRVENDQQESNSAMLSQGNKSTAKTKLSCNSNRNSKRAKLSMVLPEDLNNITSVQEESATEKNTVQCSKLNVCTEKPAAEVTEESISDQRNILAALYSSINVDAVNQNILDIKSMLIDDSIESFLQLARKIAPEYEIHPTIYFQFFHLLPDQYLGCHGKIHLQIIGGHPDFQHWIFIRFDGIYLQIFDSIHRNHKSQLHPVEIAYLNHRYPQLLWENVHFVKVTEQPDNTSCGVYCIAFMTDTILKKNPMKQKYSRNATVMRNHAVTVLRREELISFPRRR